jgi:glycosyltransferase involved in cell wall biosynthesis
MDTRGDKLSVLRIILAIRETSAPYNQFTLPWAAEHDITLCTFFPSEITPPKTITLFEGDGTVKGFFRVLKDALDANEYDIIHAHSPHVGFLFWAATLFGYRKYAHSTVTTVHDSYEDFKLRNRLMFLPVFASFRRVICCSRSSFESFPTLYKRLAGKRLTYVTNGLDIARVDRTASKARRVYPRKSDFTVIAISRLVEVKNPFTALEAFGQSADPLNRMVYLGAGPLHETLVSKTRQMALKHRVEFTGMVPRERVFEYLLNADLFISTSRGEGLPVAVLEAMACGCPVVLSDIPPHREIAEQVDFIPLVKPDDATGFAREINWFRVMPAAERAAIGQKCRALVEARFSLTAMQAGYLEIYEQLLQKPGISSLEVAG